MAGMISEMRLQVVMCLLTATVLSSAAVISYFYEARSVGLLPVLDYPLRAYVLPFLATGIFFAVLAILLHLRVKRNE
jgi:hypothetical protein